MKKLCLPNVDFSAGCGGACVAQSDQPRLGDLAKQTPPGEKSQ